MRYLEQKEHIQSLKDIFRYLLETFIESSKNSLWCWQLNTKNIMQQYLQYETEPLKASTALYLVLLSVILHHLHFDKPLSRSRSSIVQHFTSHIIGAIKISWVSHVIILWRNELHRVRFFINMTFILIGFLIDHQKTLSKLRLILFLIWLLYKQKDILRDPKINNLSHW